MITLSRRAFPKAIVHIDADAFFASVEQARNPALKGQPVVTGKERGIASAVSYEGKALGITRGMTTRELRRICPAVVHLPSDYETYSLYSTRMFSIMRQHTALVEEYSIDEAFAELTGLRRARRLSYAGIAIRIKEEIERALGITVSVGLAPSKVVAKIASKWHKPSGFTVIAGRDLPAFLRDVPVGQDFRHRGMEVTLTRATAFPTDIVRVAARHFDALFDPRVSYRLTGVVLSHLTENHPTQLDFFEGALRDLRSHRADEVPWGKQTA